MSDSGCGRCGKPYAGRRNQDDDACCQCPRVYLVPDEVPDEVKKGALYAFRVDKREIYLSKEDAVRVCSALETLLSFDPRATTVTRLRKELVDSVSESFAKAVGETLERWRTKS